MKKRTLIFFFTFFLGFSPFSSPLLAQNCLEQHKNGLIDWSNGIVEAIGMGTSPSRSINSAQARAMAKNSAIMSARENLFNIIKNVRINSNTLIKDFMANSDIKRTEVQNFVQLSRVVNISYISNNSVKASVAMKLTGSFADAVLPKSIQTIYPVHQPKSHGGVNGEVFTGLVLDCRGLNVKPAVAPHILDEDSNEIYGVAFASRDYVVKHGMSGYAKGLTAARTDQRVGDNPLIVTGLRSSDSGLSDIVISIADAERIRRAASNMSFLHKCRLIIVLD